MPCAQPIAQSIISSWRLVGQGKKKKKISEAMSEACRKFIKGLLCVADSAVRAERAAACLTMFREDAYDKKAADTRLLQNGEMGNRWGRLKLRQHAEVKIFQ